MEGFSQKNDSMIFGIQIYGMKSDDWEFKTQYQQQ
jgi:hypothetical protein